MISQDMTLNHLNNHKNGAVIYFLAMNLALHIHVLISSKIMNKIHAVIRMEYLHAVNHTMN